eukprot:6497337-Karenia_brevis.AAC.1
MALHIPFRSMDELQNQSVINKVPAHCRQFATALLITDNRTDLPVALRRFLRRPRLIRAEMKAEAQNEDFISDILEWIDGQRLLVEEYMSGRQKLRQEQQGAAATNSA